MKRFIMAAMAAVAFAGQLAADNGAATAAQSNGGAALNSAAASGYVVRGRLMFEDGNYRGCVDQLQQALRLLDSGFRYNVYDANPAGNVEREDAEFYLAIASAAIPGRDAMPLFEGFLMDYPSSRYRERVLLAMADCLYDRNEYAEALKLYDRVEPDALNDDLSEDCRYRRAFCLLKLGEYSKAEAVYAGLKQTKRYANRARFYEGYIAYSNQDYKRARALFEGVNVAEAPADMADYYLAQIYFLEKDYRRAAERAKSLLSREVDEEFLPETRRIAGESLYYLGRESEALSYLRLYAAEADMPLPSALYLLGVDEYRNGRYHEAIQRLTPVTREDSSIGQSAYLYIGQAYLKLDNYDAAVMALDKACRMKFDADVQEMAFYNYAVAKMQGGRIPFGSSVALFEKFLQLYPQSRLAPSVANYVVKGYMTDNNYPAALQAIRNIKNPTDEVLEAKQIVLYMLGTRELQAGQTAEALAHLRESRTLSRFNSSVANESSLWIGECLYKQGNYAGASEAYDSYLSNVPRSNTNRPLAFYDRGYARFALKQFGSARKDFKEFIGLRQKASVASGRDGNHLLADAYNRVADCDYYSSDFTSADENYRQAYLLDPASGDYPMFQQGQMKGLNRDYSGKIEMLRQMTERFPNSALIPSALLEIAESYGEIGQSDRAIETYTALASRYPSTAQARQGTLLLAIAYLNSGNRQGAIAQYKRVIANYPTSEEARAAADDLKHIYADAGQIDDYAAFLSSVPDAPKMDQAELVALKLESAEKAVESGRDDDALRLATELATTYPDAPEAVAALGIKADIEYKRGRSRVALETYRELARRASSSVDVNRARIGLVRTSCDLEEYADAVATADLLLESSSLGASQKAEIAFLKGYALANQGDHSGAKKIWKMLSADMDNLYGAKSAYYLAQALFDAGQTKDASVEVGKLIEANPPHDYWLARGFILLSDIRRSEGNDFEADEYLRSLRENYPGTESDIFQMIDSRLK